MKRVLIFLLVSASFCTLSARSLLRQGTIGVGTNASFYNIQDDVQSATTKFKILPSFDFFVFENFSLGVACSFTSAQEPDEKGEWQFGPNVRYFIDAFYHFKPFVGANYMAGPSKEYVNGNLGAVFFLTKKFALEAQAQYNHIIGEAATQRVIFSGGIRLFL